jgi:hypothetical protein
LVQLINAEHARKRLDHPRLVIAGEIQTGAVATAPAADAPFAGADPEISGQACRGAPEGHPILIDRLHRFGDHSIGIDGIGPQEWRLRPEIVVTGTTMVDADGDEQQGWLIEIQIDGSARNRTEARRHLATAIAG